jgi:hypothetical protein
MEALNRIKKSVADGIQKADDEIRDRARREAERQVNGSRGASSSNGARSDANGARGWTTSSRPDGGGVPPVAQVAHSPRNAPPANVDVELIVTTMRSELDETRRRVDDFDARLEQKLTEALATLQDVASAQMRDGVDELVRREVRRQTTEEASDANEKARDGDGMGPTNGRDRADEHARKKSELETFEEAMRLANDETVASPAAPSDAPRNARVTADVIEGLDAKVAAAVASEVPPGLAKSLRALEARVAAAEAEAAAAKAECARLEREKKDESSAARAAEASAPGKGGSSGTPERDAPLEELAALKVRLEEVAEVAFSSAAAAARLDARAEKATSPSAEGVSAADFSALRGEVRRLSEVSEGSANAEHVAFAAVESSKRATEKLDELSGTVAELAAALESARGELRELRKASLEKSPSRKAQEKETRDAEAFRARLAELDASSRATAETLKTVARNTDDRLATMKLAVETELVAVMKDFEARLEAAEGETRKANDAGEQKRWSFLEARLAETTTLAESALRRADALSELSKSAERVAEASEAETRKLSDVVRAMARDTAETKAFAEDSVSRAAERAREAALAETRQTERAVWDTVMLLSADVASASRRAGSPGALRGSSQTSQTPSPRSTPRIRGEPVAGTPAGWSSNARSSSGRPAPRFAGLRRLFRSPRNDVSDLAERTDEP